MNEKSPAFRDVDESARQLAHKLIRESRAASLAVIDAATGYPSASRCLLGTDLDGTPIILISSLASHTQSLQHDPRCSVLAGNVGKGDPLAHPRITVLAEASSLDRDGPDYARIRSRFLARHPKAALYADFADFRFLRLTPVSASLNGGFGKAYVLTREDLTIAVEEPAAWLSLFEELSSVADLPAQLAELAGATVKSGWRIVGIDPAGVDISSTDVTLRYSISGLMGSPAAMKAALTAAC
ncbi:HugZ family protein [Rhizobium oryzicola]|uniref:Pyridoxamine 5'-phosphate oxidase family protein n=1 Tax=Rhizobium oryzicola TaxID=1232668 RepID=A0ABT8SVU6_9HYPH|nr:pyridoxamine 5'-phosphate oxidase family protein [Rhizobium oryzicola]MDO1582274.1 pyridoxamine 5'-phosphate oxidase family protein [Rhizobium oryzicola]